VVLALASGLPAYVLAPRLPGYDEREVALRTARHLGAEVVVVEVTAEDFVAALPEAVRHVETPLYNLHPVAKLLLARALARDGVEVALGGDGADQLFTRDRSADYLPLTRALFDAAGVTLRAPFADERVMACVLAQPPDRDKQALRRVGATLGLPEALVQGPKRAGLAPAMDLGRYAHRLPSLARLLDRPLPALDDDRTRVRWTTAALLVDAFEAA
jgi:asparagine synthetase B (glutamine-hydrolysing)